MKDNNKNQLEDVLKKRLSETEIPGNSQWEKISSRIPEDTFYEKKEINLFTRYKYLMAAGITGIMLAAGIWLFLTQIHSDIPSGAISGSDPGIPVETPEKNKPSESEITQAEEKSDNNLPENNTNKVQDKTIKTPAAKETLISYAAQQEKKDLYLPDSTRVILNKNTTLSYSKNFNINERVVIFSGEAFFDVKKVKGKPFTIIANRTQTVVVGTSFNVRSYPDERSDEVEVVTGQVRFTSKEKKDTLLLFPGFKGTVLSGEPPYKSAISDPNFLAWKTEKLIFNNTGMKEVIHTLEDYFDTKIKVEDPKILQHTFNGTYNHPQLNEILNILCIPLKLSYRKEGDSYILLKKD